MKRNIVLIAALMALAIAASLVYGEGEGEKGAQPAGPVTLIFKTTGSIPALEPDLKADLAAFGKVMAEKGVQVTVDYQNFVGSNADYTTKNTLELRSNQGPDLLVEESGRSQNYMRAGYLMALDDYVTNWKPWDKVVDPFKPWMGYKGHVYMIPVQSSAIPLYYRKDLFQKAGLSADWQPRSWEEILVAAERIKSTLPGVTPLLFIGSKEAGGQVTFSRFNLLFNGVGGQMFDEKDQKWIVASQALLDVFKFYETMAKRGLLNTSRAVAADADNWALEAFAKGTGAINLYGSWAYINSWGKGKSYEIANIEQIVGYAKMPAKVPGASGRKQDWVTQSGGWNYMIPASKSKTAATTWRLIDFLSTAERQAHYNATRGQAATRFDVMEHANFQQVKFLSDVSKWLPYTYMTPHFHLAWEGGPDQAIRNAIGKIIVGEWTAEVAMRSFAKEMEQTLGADKVKLDYKF